MNRTVIVIFAFTFSEAVLALSENWPSEPVSPSSMQQCTELGREYNQIAQSLHEKSSEISKQVGEKNEKIIQRFGHNSGRIEEWQHSPAPHCDGGTTYGYPSGATIWNLICETSKRRTTAVAECRSRVRHKSSQSKKDYANAGAATAASVYSMRSVSAAAASQSAIFKSFGDITKKVSIANAFIKISLADTGAEKQAAITNLTYHTPNVAFRGNLVSATAMAIAVKYLESVQEKAYQDLHESFRSFDASTEATLSTGTSKAYVSSFGSYYRGYNEAIKHNNEIFGDISSSNINRSSYDVIEPNFVASQEYLAEREQRQAEQRQAEQLQWEREERESLRQARDEQESTGGLFDSIMGAVGAAAGAYTTYRSLDSGNDDDGSSGGGSSYCSRMEGPQDTSNCIPN